MMNVYDHIARHGNDYEFEPNRRATFLPSNIRPGTEEKIELFRRRVELGLPMYHPNDLSFASAHLINRSIADNPVETPPNWDDDY